jgi:hypothetical protein
VGVHPCQGRAKAGTQLNHLAICHLRTEVEAGALVGRIYWDARVSFVGCVAHQGFP